MIIDGRIALHGAGLQPHPVLTKSIFLYTVDTSHQLTIDNKIMSARFITFARRELEGMRPVSQQQRKSILKAPKGPRVGSWEKMTVESKLNKIE